MCFAGSYSLYLFWHSLVATIRDKRIAEPEPPPNQPPVLRGVYVPDPVLANYPVTLRLLASDPDKDELSIVWEQSEGTMEGDVWTPPDRATEVVVSVHVSDGVNPPVSESQNITVEKPSPIPTPRLPVQTDHEPPPVPDLEIWNIISGIGIEYSVPGRVSIKVSIGDTIEQVNALVG